MLEWAAGDRPAEAAYPFRVAEAPDGMLVVDWRPALEDALADLRAGAPRGGAVALLGRNAFEPVWHRRIPPNDGGIALGQAVWAGWTEETGA